MLGVPGLARSNSNITHVSLEVALELGSSLEKSVAKAYTLLFVSSIKFPITDRAFVEDTVPTLVLPKIFSNSPTVEPSDLLINKLIASLYSP